MDEAGSLRRPASSARWSFAAANVTDGYENNPDANGEAFTNGWFRTGDQGVLDADGYLTADRPAEGAHQPRRREDLAARDR